jgi:hypothetical protein
VDLAGKIVSVFSGKGGNAVKNEANLSNGSVNFDLKNGASGAKIVCEIFLDTLYSS